MQLIAWLKSLFTKGKSDMTDIVAAVQADASAVVTAVEGAVASVEGAVSSAEAAVETTVDAFEDAASKIKGVYDKLGIDLHAWDQVTALAKAL